MYTEPEHHQDFHISAQVPLESSHQSRVLSWIIDLQGDDSDRLEYYTNMTRWHLFFKHDEDANAFYLTFGKDYKCTMLGR